MTQTVKQQTCQKQYVGGTKGPLNLRMNGHRDYWYITCLKGHQWQSIFAQQNMISSNTPLFVALTIAQKRTDSTRKSHESYWIRRLNTLRPNGINKNDEKARLSL